MATSPARRTGTGFVNLADWTRANAGASNALVDRLAGDVNAQGTLVDRDVSRMSNQFQDAADLANIRYEDPGGDVARARYLSNVSYAGPKSLYDFGDFDGVLDRADRTESAAQRAGDYYGRQAALQDAYGGTGAYTPGQQRLDSALAGVAGAQRFADLNQRWGGLYNRAQNADLAARNTANAYTQGSAEAATRYGQEADRIVAAREAAEREAERNQWQAEEDAARRQREQDVINRDRARRQGPVNPGEGQGYDDWRRNRIP